MKRKCDELKIAIVTGGSSDLGRAITYALYKKDFTVFSTYFKNKPKETPDKNKIIYSCVDGRSKEEVLRFGERVLSLGTPEIVVNNSGIVFNKLIIESKVEEFENVINTNFGSTLNYSYTFMKSMIEKRFGNMVNITSVSSNKVRYGNSAYGCSKIIIERFSRSLAFELARFNVNINCISPGFVDSGMFRRLGDKKKRDFIKGIPKRKLLSPSDVSNLVIDLGLRRIDTTGSIFQIGNGENV